MPDAKLDTKELKKLIVLARKKPLAFAFCPGPRDDHLFLIDKKKKPKQLLLIAKQEGPGKKVAFGTCLVVDKEMRLTCEKTLPKMAKTIKKHLRDQKIPLSVVILDADGTVANPGEETPEEAAGDASASAASSQAPDSQAPESQAPNDDAKAQAAELVQRIKALLGDIAAMSQGHADKLNKAKARAVAQLKGGDLQGAQSTISAMEGAIAKLAQARASPAAAQDKAAQEDAKETTAQTPETDTGTGKLTGAVAALGAAAAKLGGPAGEKLTAALGNVAKMIAAGNLMAAQTLLDRIETATARETDKKAAKDKGGASAQADKWASVQARLQPLIAKLMQEGRGDLAAINRVFNYATEQAQAGNFDKALGAATRAVVLIKAADQATETAAVSEAKEAIPDNIVAYTKTRLSWIKSRAGMRKELEGLKYAIDKATAGIEGLEQVPAKSGGLFTYIDDIDSDLEDTLDRLVNAGDADARAALKSQARKIIDQYSGVLESDFFQAVDDNGFTKTNIRAGAVKSLQEVRAALEN